MARYRQSTFIRDHIKGFLVGAAAVLVVAAAVLAFTRNGDGEEGPPAPEIQGDVYVCGGCGKEYAGQFPCAFPWAEYPAELPPVQILDAGRETAYNGSLDGATPVAMYQRVTGDLSSRDDLDFYRFEVEVPDGVNFIFTFDGSRGGYTYLWDAAIYDTDGVTELKSGPIQIEEGKEATFSATGLEPGAYYLKISAASGGNPLLNGYSDTDYHVAFLPRCAEHTTLAHALTAAPTCSQAGTVATMCTTCGILLPEERLEPLEHIWSRWRTVEGISLGSPLGECSRTCALCGEVETDPLLLHLLSRDPKPDPEAVTVVDTWTEPGAAACGSKRYVKTVCSVCGSEEVEAQESAGHTYGPWEVGLAATCAAQGQRSRTCAVCGHVETEPIDPAAHTYGEAVRVSGSILDGPIVSQRTCAVCGHVDTAEHGWTRWILPVLAVLGLAAAAAAAVLAVRAVRGLRRRAVKRRRERTFLCPYCFKTSKLSQVQIQCTDPHCDKGRPFLRGSSIVWDARGLPVSARCACGHTSNLVVCPQCHHHLPESTLAGEDMIISVVGSRDTGKTHFISVIINELIGRIIPAFGGSFEGFDDTMERYTRLYKDRLYGQEPMRLDGTGSFRNNVKGEDLPLIYTLKLRREGPLGRGKKVRLFTLVFFDSAGEDLQSSEETMRKLNRYICKSKGIIFLIDPLKIPAVRAQLDEREVGRASSGERYQPDDILVRVSDLIRGDKRLRGSDKIEVPVSVVFSKFDVIEPIIPRGCTILEPSPHCEEGVFDLSDWHNVDAEVQGLLQTWGAESFLRQLEMNYESWSCFTVSALGMHNNPGSDGRIDRPRPHRIEDPLLWLLVKQKVIRARKRRGQGRGER